MPQSSPRQAPAAATARRTARWTSDFVKAWAVPVLLFFSVRTVLGQTFHIPTGSMEPTMLVGDWLVVNNLAYGPHIPFTERSLPGYDEPERGDIVVFKSPYQADEAALGNDPEPVLVKRLWGVGGDTLHMRNGVLHVNGVAYASPESEESRAVARDYAGPEFAWQSQHAVHGFAWQSQHAVHGSRFGEPPAALRRASGSPKPRHVGPAGGAGRSPLHARRPSPRLEGQPVLGDGAAQQRARSAGVRVLQLQCDRLGSVLAGDHRHPVGTPRSHLPLTRSCRAVTPPRATAVP